MSLLGGGLENRRFFLWLDPRLPIVHQFGDSSDMLRGKYTGAAICKSDCPDTKWKQIVRELRALESFLNRALKYTHDLLPDTFWRRTVPATITACR